MVTAAYGIMHQAHPFWGVQGNPPVDLPTQALFPRSCQYQN